MSKNRLNNKGITLIELIVSFAIVGVAIIYFFQTLYTVKKLYTTSREETQKYVDESYTFKVIDKYIDENGIKYLNNVNNDICYEYGLPCTELYDELVASNDKKNTYKIVIIINGEEKVLYKTIPVP